MTTQTYQPLYRTQEEADEMENQKYSKLVEVLIRDEQVWQQVSVDHTKEDFATKGKESTYFDKHCRGFGSQGFDAVLKTLAQHNPFNELYLSVQKVNRVYNFDERKRITAAREAWKNVSGNPFEKPQHMWRDEEENYNREQSNGYPPFPYMDARLWLAEPDQMYGGSHCDLGSRYGIALIEAPQIPDAEMGKILQQYKLNLLKKHQIKKDFATPYPDPRFDDPTLKYANELMLLYKVQGIKE